MALLPGCRPSWHLLTGNDASDDFHLEVTFSDSDLEQRGNVSGQKHGMEDLVEV
jgi:hypothetical protein